MKEKENLMNLNSTHELSHNNDLSNNKNNNNHGNSNNNDKKDSKNKKMSMVPILNNNNNIISNPYGETLAGVLLGDSHYDITGTDIDAGTGMDSGSSHLLSHLKGVKRGG